MSSRGAGCARRRSDDRWRLTALLGADPDRDLERAREFNREHAAPRSIDSLEGKLVDARGHRTDRSRALGGEFALFVELPDDRDHAPLIAALAARTALTERSELEASRPRRFLRRSASFDSFAAASTPGMSFKATAGLHHPLRAEYRLTYDADSPTGVMYGYLNVFVASALMTQGLSDADAVCVLEERDPRAFTIR